jgi:glucose-6-phosphate isomerase
MRLDNHPLFDALKEAATEARSSSIKKLFDQDASRTSVYQVDAPHIFLDYSKNQISNSGRDLLIALSNQCGLQESIENLFSGKHLNATEDRPALHTALRANSSEDLMVDGTNITKEISATLEQIDTLVDALHNGKLLGSTGKRITQLVSIGIGGSYLGPKMTVNALAPFHVPGLQCFFVANIDGSDIAETLKQVDPETCLILIQSKSFSTLETLENGRVAISWLQQQLGDRCELNKHLMAVTSNTKAAMSYGIDEALILPMWDWVGGRYSMWSAIGFPIAFQLGMDGFRALLKGAAEIDEHFRSAPAHQNLPVILALVGIWNRNLMGHEALAIIPYNEQLRFLPEHLQQLDMESNGKSVDLSGEQIECASGPIIFGGSGTNGQHAYHQLFHQGTTTVPVEFIIPKHSHYQIAEHHQHLIANCLAQSSAMMVGKNLEQVKEELLEKGASVEQAEYLAPHKVIPGNKPSNTLILESLTPESLGALIATYEHKVFVQGQIWGINSFDQWGVELGKEIEATIFPLLSNTTQRAKTASTAVDPSTAALIERLKS